MSITVVLGTARIDNMSQHVARAVTDAITEHTPTVQLVSVADHITQAATVPPWGAGGADEQPTEWKQIVADTDTFVFVLPEYNHSFPGEWKLLMDSLFPEYADKTAYVVAVGGGQFAGTRVMEHVLPVLVNFKFSIGAKRLHIANAGKIFATDGTLADVATQERIDAFAETVAAR